MLYDELGIKSIEELHHACQLGKVARIPHFSEKTQETILKNIERFNKSGRRFLSSDAMKLQSPFSIGLSQLKEVPKS